MPFASVAVLPTVVRLANRNLMDEAEAAGYRAGVADRAARDRTR